MPSIGSKNINDAFFLTSKPPNMLDGTFFVFQLLLNTLFLLFRRTLTLKNIISLLFFDFLPLLTYLSAYFEHFQRYTLLFFFGQNLIIHLLPFRNKFNIEKHLQCLVYPLLVSKFVHSTNFQHFNLQMHEPYLSLFKFPLQKRQARFISCLLPLKW